MPGAVASPRPAWARLRAGFRLSRPDQVVLVVVVLGAGYAAGAALRSGSDAGVGRVASAWTAAAVVAVAVSVHAVNEYADAETDALTVRTRFSGGSGALADHGLPAAFALRVAVAAALAAGALGAVAGVGHDVPVLVLVLLGVGLVGGWSYSVGPWPWSRHGAGEVANAVLGGLLLPATGSVLAGAPLGRALLVAVPFALLVLVDLLETQWADRAADRAVGKRTLASRLSPPQVRRVGGVAAAAAYAVSFLVHPWSVAVAGLLAAPLSAYGVRRLGTGRPGPSVAAMVVFLVAQAAAWLARG